MDGKAPYCPVLEKFADLSDRSYVVVDVGCSHGLDPLWESLRHRLVAFGFDSNVAEVERLTAENSNPNVEFVAAKAELPDQHPLKNKTRVTQSPWHRLSVTSSLEFLEKNNAESDHQNVLLNKWTSMTSAENSLVIPEFLKEKNINEIDFLKIDVDGKDFEVLSSFESELANKAIFGVAIEINYCGTADPTDNTFHNIDRFMRTHGYDLFGLSTRKYSSRGLANRYDWEIPSSGNFGRLLQGDALYFLDLCREENEGLVRKLAPEKLVDHAITLAAFDLPDCAAEILIKYENIIRKVVDHKNILDLLAHQAQGESSNQVPYSQYMKLFRENHPYFYFGAHERPAPLEKSPLI